MGRLLTITRELSPLLYLFVKPGATAGYQLHNRGLNIPVRFLGLICAVAGSYDPLVQARESELRGFISTETVPSILMHKGIMMDTDDPELLKTL